MRKVGIRALKDRLSEYLRLVRGGENVLITDRGETIAELAPPNASRADGPIHPELVALARRGLITLASPGGKSACKKLPRPPGLKKSSTELLDEDRGSR